MPKGAVVFEIDGGVSKVNTDDPNDYYCATKSRFCG